MHIGYDDGMEIQDDNQLFASFDKMALVAFGLCLIGWQMTGNDISVHPVTSTFYIAGLITSVGALLLNYLVSLHNFHQAYLESKTVERIHYMCLVLSVGGLFSHIITQHLFVGIFSLIFSVLVTWIIERTARHLQSITETEVQTNAISE